MQVSQFDVVVMGAGASGIAAAITAAEEGLSVALVDRAPMPGGELIGGLDILGSANGEGEWVVRGILTRLLERLDALGGYVGLFFDWRTMWGVCFDPELMKLVLVDELRSARVQLRLSTLATDVVLQGSGRIDALVVHSGRHPELLRARTFIDASGDGWLSDRAGARMIEADGAAGFQPVSLTFRMSGVDFPELLEFIKTNPDDLIVAENPFITASKQEAAANIASSGVPFVAIGSQHENSRLHAAIQDGRMFPTTAFYMWPTSRQKSEVGLNVTRISDVDGTDMAAVSGALQTLTQQVLQARTFLTETIPGFSRSSISALAARVGVRETKRIVGVDELTTDDVLSARKRKDGVARGSHHIDIHGKGTYQLRKYIPNGGSYDIPMGALIPAGMENLVVAGRCLSSSREANGSARVMGSCLAMGEAAGVMAALSVQRSVSDVQSLAAEDVRIELARRGALVGDDVA